MSKIIRFAPAASLVAVAVALVAFQAQYRHFEAVLAAFLFDSGGVRTFSPPDVGVVVFRMGETKAFGLEITPECTSAFLILPFVLAGAAILLRRRVRPGRVALGLGLVTLLLVGANQLRIGMIAGLIDSFGLDGGYQWGHLILGSLISIVFVALGCVLMVWIVTSGRPVPPLTVA